MTDYQTIKDRLVFYIKYMGIAKSAFEKSIGASNGYINSIKKSIGQEYLDQISNVYADLDISWLLTGKGEMLKSEQPKEEVVAKPNENEFLSYLKKQVEELKAENDNLKMENNRLREENGYYKGLLETNSIQYKQTAS